MNRLKIFLVTLLAVPASLLGAAAAPEKDAPVLKWSSSEEVGVYGYIVYRAVDREGPFLRVNSKIIPRDPAWDDKDADSREKKSWYRYVDESADPAVTNYYYIDAIGESGRKKRLTGVVSKSPKLAGQEN